MVNKVPQRRTGTGFRLVRLSHLRRVMKAEQKRDADARYRLCILSRSTHSKRTFIAEAIAGRTDALPDSFAIDRN